MTDDDNLRNIGGVVERFDWEAISPLILASVVHGMAQVAEPDNPMVTNDAGMRFLKFLWKLGIEVVDITEHREEVALLEQRLDDCLAGHLAFSLLLWEAA